jgi:hypothetical protein
VSGFAGKQILFIGIGFYDYEKSIVERLRSRGAHVDSYLALPPLLRQSAFATPLRLAGIEGMPLIRRHERDILRRTGEAAYDQVLVIKSTELRPEFLHALRRQQRRAEFILYQWDSLARMPGIDERIPFFDRVLTFDRQDAMAHPNFAFRPLFYRHDVLHQNPAASGAIFHLCFIGWLHSDRLNMLRRLQAAAESRGITFQVYLYTGLRTFAGLLFSNNARDVHVRTMPYSELLECYRRATVIIDLPHAQQSGLTMRAIETVGIGRKLMTTARDVVNYDFYSSGNVRVIHGEVLQLDGEFLREPANPYPEHVRRGYSLDVWIDDVFAPSRAASSRTA